MKYYLIVGEASGDLHASHLMRSIQEQDPQAEFRFFGGDLMTAVGGTRVRHYKELAYMGFMPVLLHLRTIFRNMAMCKRDIDQWKPDVLILVDYADFNLNIAKHVAKGNRKVRKSHQGHEVKIYYYISPKIWAWKEWRIRSIKRDIDKMFCILPFEVEFYEGKHHYPVHYVGNPTASEVRQYKEHAAEGNAEFLRKYQLKKPLIAILCGSRRQEIKDNLPGMLEATAGLNAQYQLVIAGAPAIEREYYEKFTIGHDVTILPPGNTYQLLYNATAALVTSGTATLETGMFNVPQVVCYETPIQLIVRFVFDHIMTAGYISLVNLIAGREVVPELLADRFSAENIRRELMRILPGGEGRQAQLDGYALVHRRLGNTIAPDNAAKIMTGNKEN